MLSNHTGVLGCALWLLLVSSLLKLYETLFTYWWNKLRFLGTFYSGLDGERELPKLLLRKIVSESLQEANHVGVAAKWVDAETETCVVTPDTGGWQRSMEKRKRCRKYRLPAVLSTDDSVKMSETSNPFCLKCSVVARWKLAVCK